MTVKVLMVGCGDLGAYAAQLLKNAQFDVTALCRSARALDGIDVVIADVTKPNTLAAIRDMAPDYIVYCISADARTDAAYQSQYVTGLQHIIQTQTDNPQLSGFIFISSTRVYGNETDDLIDQSTPAKPADFGGRRLLEAEQCLAQLACPTVALRLSGIYGNGRLRMIRLAKQAQWPANNSWTNRIHRDDAAAFIVYVIQRLVNRQPVLPQYIVTDNLPTRQYTVLTWIASHLGINVPVAEPALAGGKRLSNQAMLDTGFQLQYPDFKAGYAALLQDQV